MYTREPRWRFRREGIEESDVNVMVDGGREVQQSDRNESYFFSLSLSICMFYFIILYCFPRGVLFSSGMLQQVTMPRSYGVQQYRRRHITLLLLLCVCVRLTISISYVMFFFCTTNSSRVVNWNVGFYIQSPTFIIHCPLSRYCSLTLRKLIMFDICVFMILVRFEYISVYNTQ